MRAPRQSARAAIAALLIVALVAACAPSAALPSPAGVSLPSPSTIALGPTLGPATPAPTAGAHGVSEWNAGQVAVYDPADGSWREWRLPGSNPQAYSVYVDDRDLVWLTDFGANAIVVFDPASESFTVLELDAPGAAIRQMLSRPGEAWGAASSADKLYVVRLVYS